MKETRTQEVRSGVYETISQIVSAFASPARLKIIQILAQAECSVEELAQETGESVANVSQHLQRLARMRIVSCERRGLSRIYKIQNPMVLQLWEGFQNLAHEVDEDLNHKEDILIDASLVAEETPEEVLELVEKGKATLLDVRTSKETAMTKVPGAIAVPMEDLAGFANYKSLGLVKSKTVYVYCRGRYCGKASNAVKHLRKLGYEAYRLRESPFQLQLIQGDKQ
ncbi:ArsR/SmtB family transcription factor [Bdellovibrio sp. HCB-162]|uniref:ArsR/SmtB family transcription factor n=1 Tax=Bdellovibrio sp. HCB-162 TaxID=3394234 RepID=UPI0039BD0EEC